MRLPFFLLAVLLLAGRAVPAAEPATFTVRLANVTDEKAVFATVESRNVVPARTRIGGTIASLSVKDGEEVKKGQVLAVVADEKLLLQRDLLDADIAGLRASLAQAEGDFARAQALVGQGAVSRQQYDRARTARDLAQSALNARIQSRAVVEQQIADGQVLAPTDGRVLEVPDTAGTVVLPGETIATIAEHDFVLRLEVPERSARYLSAGDSVRIDGTEIGEPAVEFGHITLVYPEVPERPRRGGRHHSRPRQLFRGLAHPRLGPDRHASRVHHSGRLHRNALRARLRPARAGGREHHRRADPARRAAPDAFDAGRHRGPVRPAFGR